MSESGTRRLRVIAASPAADRRERPSTPNGRRASRSRPRRRSRVLIVDDSRDTCEIYAAYLGHFGFSTLTAHDGSNAVAMAINLKPDVIVMDVSMPNVDGITAIRWLKSHPRTRAIPVILLTGYPADAIEQGGIEAGAAAFLTKPCPPPELEVHVRRLIDRPRSA
jgi:CheY-like chemotaxis protein